MPRREEEPEWDSEEGGSSGSESGFDDEEASGGGSSEEGSGSEEESGSDDDYESGSEEESGSDDESMSDEDSDASDSEDYSDDETTDRDEDMEDIDFFDEEQKGKSNGSLTNDPSDDPAWARFVPAKIMAMGVVAAGVCCCLMVLIPLALIIGLSVGLTRGGGDKGSTSSPIAPTAPPVSLVSPTMAPPTLAPTTAPLIKTAILSAKATNTIYREGLLFEESSGAADEMLVQRGPAGDTELPSAYSLVQFEGITGIDNDFMSFGDYLDSIKGLEVQFCLNVASSGENEVTYSTCLLPPESTSTAIDQLTGAEAPQYEIPKDCVNGVVTFKVDSSTDKVCVDVAPLLVATGDSMNTSTGTTESAESTGQTESTEPAESTEQTESTEPAESTEQTESTESTESTEQTESTEPDESTEQTESTESTESEPNASLRGRRRLEETSDTGSEIPTYLFIIDTLEESEVPGTTFYSTTASEGRAPVLTIQGDNTCQTAAELVCAAGSGFSKLCELVGKAGLVEVLSSDSPRTVFAPLDDAFAALSPDTLKALNDVDALKDVLTYHVVADKIMQNDLNCNLPAEANQGPINMANGGATSTLCDDRGAIYQVGTGTSPGVNSLPEIITSDIETCFGVVHVVDQVLIPARDAGTNQTCISEDGSGLSIMEFCAEPDPSLATFCMLVTGINLDSVFSSGLYTIFAPTNEAFAMDFDASFQEVRLATRILLQHIISGSAIEIFDERFACDKEVEMANGDFNRVTCREGMPYFGGPGNTPESTPSLPSSSAIVGCNFVVHPIDRIILPEMGGDTKESEDKIGSGDDDEGYEPCGICGGGASLTLPDATIEIPASVGLPAETGDITCQMADTFCKSGACSPDTCIQFAEGISASCGCQEEGIEESSDSGNNVVDVLLQKEETYATLLSLATSAGLVQSLQSEQDYTLFAPTELAFDKLKEQNRPLFKKLKAEEFGIHLNDVLLHHLVQEKILLQEITDQQVVAANGDTIQFRINKNERRFANDNRIEDETIADNGIIHSVNGLILPSWGSQNILDVIGMKNELSVVDGLMEQANLVDTLTGDGPFTLFAPVNNAVEEELKNLDNNSATIASVLKYHVVEGVHPASSISDGLGLSTVHGEEILFNVVGETVTINGFKITETDILANNGIVHVIDGAMVPENLSAPSIPESPSAAWSCSICTGSSGVFKLNSPDNIVNIPDSIAVPNIEGQEAFCTLLEQTCQMGYCDPEVCNALAESGAKETCGCEEV